jgi:hypothetical protein
VNEFTVRVRGVREASDAFAAMSTRIEMAMFKTVRESTAVLERAAKENFRSRKGGRNDPAEPPRPTLRTGNLRNSIKSDGPTRVGFASFSGRVGPTLIYGRRVELGFNGMVAGYTTRKGAVVGPKEQHSRKFPYLAPALEENRTTISDIWTRNVREAIKG